MKALQLDKIKDPNKHEQIKKEYNLLKEVMNLNIEINDKMPGSQHVVLY